MGNRQRVIDEVLQPDRIAQLPPFPRIKRFIWREYVDSTAQEALDITAVVEGEPDRGEMGRASFAVFDALLTALDEAGIDLYPHVGLLTERDLDERAAIWAEQLKEEEDEAEA